MQITREKIQHKPSGQSSVPAVFFVLLPNFSAQTLPASNEGQNAGTPQGKGLSIHLALMLPIRLTGGLVG